MARRLVPLIVLVSVVTSVARTLVGGQDLNFDLQTYHYYLGYSAFVDRFALDYLAASFQGYQSPVPYVLLYWLDSVGTPPFINASIHAAIHALNLILLFLLAQSLVGTNATGRDRVTVVAFWLLGAVAPTYWHLVGTSYADLLTSVPMLAGLWLTARAMPSSGPLSTSALGMIAVGAALTGAAAGLRMHNAIYVAGLLCALALAQFSSPRDRVRSLGVFCPAAFAGWLLCFAPWAQRLYREFGNPLFPFYNAVFRSADFPAANLPLTNFVPDNLLDLVTLPFRMASYAYWVYVEARLPDVRPGLLVVCLAACALLWLFRRGLLRDDGRSAPERHLILVFFAASGLLWLATSSNGRYGIALFLLGGPVCGVMLSRLLPFRYVLAAIAAVLVWQGLLQGMLFREFRVASTPWASRYFDWNLPDRYKSEPATFLAFGLQTGSTLAPRVHPASSHVNLVGQYTSVIDGPGSDRIRRVIAMPHRRLYGVFDFDYTQTGEPGAESIKTYFRDHLRLWGLDFTDGSCDAVSLPMGTERLAWIKRAAGFVVHAIPPSFLVCELRSITPGEHERALAEFRSFATGLERFGAACPRYFEQPLSYTRVYQRWVVSKPASLEWRLDVEDEGAIYLKQSKPPGAVLPLGRVTREAMVATEPDCRKWFSRLAELAAQKRE
jgi:hypothetical protein